MHEYENVSKICFLEKDCFGEKYMYELDIKNAKETYMEKSADEPGFSVNKSDETAMKLKGKKLYDMIKSWNSSYINKKVFDGFECIFFVEFNDGKFINVYCKNNFPDDFTEFMKSIGRRTYG